MATRLYVGNLPFNFTNQDLQALFGSHGTVRSAEVIMDRVTGRSRGFGFVEMDSEQSGRKAIAAIHDQDVEGRRITVNEARERAPRPAGGPAGLRPGGGGGPRPGGFGGPRPGGFGVGHAGGEGGGRGGGRSEARHRGERFERERGDRYSDGGRARRRGGDDDER